jgi:hypothetical protein
MHFLADESCDMAVVRALQGIGHDVVRVADRGAGIKDIEVAEIARSDIGKAAVSAVEALAERLHASFVVVEPWRFRIADLKP